MSQKQTTNSEQQKELLRVLARGAVKVFENAEKLFNEAILLRENGALSRALFLHQISMEECAKVERLGWWATGLIMHDQVDAAKLTAALASHKAKNYTNAYMLPRTAEEKQAQERGDLKASLEAFAKLQAEFHLESNTAKNAALYVDFQDGNFTAPDDQITSEMVAAITIVNAEFLQLMRPKVEMLQRWPDDIAAVKESCDRFKARLEELQSQLPDDPTGALSTLMEEMFGGRPPEP